MLTARQILSYDLPESFIGKETRGEAVDQGRVATDRSGERKSARFQDAVRFLERHLPIGSFNWMIEGS
jgi:hypothetical protein